MLEKVTIQQPVIFLEIKGRLPCFIERQVVANPEKIEKGFLELPLADNNILRIRPEYVGCTESGMLIYQPDWRSTQPVLFPKDGAESALSKLEGAGWDTHRAREYLNQCRIEEAEEAIKEKKDSGISDNEKVVKKLERPFNIFVLLAALIVVGVAAPIVYFNW